eukprot:1610361-Rhodomonas_salina.2
MKSLRETTLLPGCAAYPGTENNDAATRPGTDEPELSTDSWKALLAVQPKTQHTTPLFPYTELEASFPFNLISGARMFSGVPLSVPTLFRHEPHVRGPGPLNHPSHARGTCAEATVGD